VNAALLILERFTMFKRLVLHIEASPTTLRLVSTLLICWLTANFAVAADALTPLELGQVQVGGEIGRRIDVTVNNNLLALDADKDFLPPFIEKQQTGGYIGLGKLIDASVRFAASTHDPQVLALKRHLVSSVIDAQDDDGYIGMLAAGHRMRGMWDVHEMAYLIYALATDYRYFHEERSLSSARKAADYILQHWDELPPDWDLQTGVATHVSVTGLERAMINLSRLTNDLRFLDFCLEQRQLPEWDLGIVIGRRPLIEGHIYAYLCRCLAQLELYRDMPDERLLRQTRRAIDFLTRQDGMTITGGCGQWEIWTDDRDGRGQLGETCATAYQIRLFDSLLRLKGDSHYGDLMERTIYNALFAAQSPDGRKIRYYSPLEGPRVYHPGDTYCCPCNFRRIIAELPTMIYYRDDQAITVNLYTPSQAKCPLAEGLDVTLRQETDYPNSGRVTIVLHPSQPAEFDLRLRIPTWCAKARATVNDQTFGTAPGGTFFVVRRLWQAGDQIGLEMPMNWRLIRGVKRQAGRAAVLRGPLVFCLNPSSADSLAMQDGADLGRITLDPLSFAEPETDNSVRPHGIACRVQAWKSGYAVQRPGDLSLRLSEFPDPGGTATYFRLQNLDVAVDDELLHGDTSPSP
jgi:DUF1680 family protein